MMTIEAVTWTHLIPVYGSLRSGSERYFSGTPRLSAKRLTSSVCSW
jgi:hypothetical protein